jgi:hypothetical protein
MSRTVKPLFGAAGIRRRRGHIGFRFCFGQASLPGNQINKRHEETKQDES